MPIAYQLTAALNTSVPKEEWITTTPTFGAGHIPLETGQVTVLATSYSAQSSSGKDTFPVDLVVGCTIGGVIGLAIIVGIVLVFCLRRPKYKRLGR
jgi:hypothetical protein